MSKTVAEQVADYKAKVEADLQSGRSLVCHSDPIAGIGYIDFPRIYWRCSELTLHEKAVLLSVSDRMRGQKTFQSRLVSEVSDDLGLPPQETEKYLQSLCDKGFLYKARNTL